MENNLLIETEQLASKFKKGSITYLTLNRVQAGNAFNKDLIDQLHHALDTLQESEVRLLIINANGKFFSSGADLNWMLNKQRSDNLATDYEIKRLSQLLFRIDNFPSPTMAVIQGPAYGGALGLIAACDFAIASTSATFSFSEVALGLIPAVISPYIVRALGVRQARRFFLSGEKFTATEAVTCQLIHRYVSDEQLNSSTRTWCESILKNAPQAQKEAKQLLKEINDKPINSELEEFLCKKITKIREADEAQQRISSFLNKRHLVSRDK